MNEELSLKIRITSMLMLVLAAFFWGSTFLFTKILIKELEVYTLIAARSIIASVILYFFYKKVIYIEFTRLIKNVSIWFFAVAGFIALALQTESLKYTTAANAAFITTLFIVFLPFIKFFIFKRAVPASFYGVVFIAIIGLYIISIGFNMPHAFNRGDFLSLCCALFYAFYILFLERLSYRFSEGSLMFFYFTLQFILSLIIVIFNENFTTVFHLNTSAYLNLLALAVIGSAVPYLLMAKGQRYVPSHVAGIIYNLEPVSATFLAYLFIGEAITMNKIIGGAIIFTALMVGVKK